jgi:hypothetical protein
MFWVQKAGSTIFLVQYILEPLYTESGVLKPLGSGCGVLEHEALMGAGWIAALDS